jgi:ATP-dependent Lhr-like helicase
VLRRLEARGEIRGGRFVSGPFGEQYALPEAVELLRAARRESSARITEAHISVAAADPLNLAGIVVPGNRIAATPNGEVRFVNGVFVEAMEAMSAQAQPRHSKRTRSIADMLRNEAVVIRSPQPSPLPGLFQ